MSHFIVQLVRPRDTPLLRIEKLSFHSNIPLRVKGIIPKISEGISMLFFQLQDHIMLRNNLNELSRTLLLKQFTDFERKKTFTCHTKKSEPS
ncbi:hypothetical protein CFB39_31870 [Burkholderia sp. AU6039]|nr:hypothetical protein CFB39_31870 [Burkholderia sp. AU6039]